MSNIQLFNQIANQYDTPGRISESTHITKEIRNALKNIDTRTKTLLDFGCGTGLIGLDLISDFQTAYFMDPAAKMLEIVEEKIKNLSITNAKIIRPNDPLPKADVIIVSLVLLHIPDYLSTINQLKNHLRSGGLILIVDFDETEGIATDKIHHGFNRDYLKSQLEDAGLVVTENRIIKTDSKVAGVASKLFLMVTG